MAVSQDNSAGASQGISIPYNCVFLFSHFFSSQNLSGFSREGAINLHCPGAFFCSAIMGPGQTASSSSLRTVAAHREKLSNLKFYRLSIESLRPYTVRLSRMARLLIGKRIKNLTIEYSARVWLLPYLSNNSTDITSRVQTWLAATLEALKVSGAGSMSGR